MRIAEVYAVAICGSLTSMPSSVTLCWSARAPATDPYRGSTVAGLLVGMKSAPGCRLSRCTTFCASTGRLRICSRDITLPTLASEVLRCEVSDTTLTVSETPPSSRTMVSRLTVSTWRLTPSTIAVLKPVSSTFNLYMPCCTLLSRKLPRPSVTVTCAAPVATCVAVTVAPGITDFCASVTSPTSAAVPVCACAVRASNGKTTTHTARVQACSRSVRSLVKASSKEAVRPIQMAFRTRIPAVSHFAVRLKWPRLRLMSSKRTGWIVCAAVMAATAAVAARQPTFRSGVDLVTVDAAVLDGDGRPVPGLRAEDFRIEVDGRPRRIVSAHFVDLDEPSERSLPPAPHFSSNAGAGDGRIVVIAVDETHIRRLEGRRAIEAASRFIDVLPAIDRVGAMALTSDTAITLTRDRLAARQRLAGMIGHGDLSSGQFNLGISEALEIADGSRARLADAVLRECGRSLTEYVNTARAADDPSSGRDSCPEHLEQQSRGIAQQAHAQARTSLAALEALIARLKDLPGPKTIVLLSEGMIVDPRRVDLSRLAAGAQAARVTIYSLLLDIPLFDATQERVSPAADRD